MSENRAIPASWPDIAGRMDGREHVLAVRVYYEDTDFSGFVYHANYIKFCERGRSDFLRLAGVHHRELHWGGSGGRMGFVVRRMNCEFLRPATIDEVLEVRTRFLEARGARFELYQRILRDGEPVFAAAVTAALVDGAGRPKRLPEDMRAALETLTWHEGKPDAV